MSDELAEKVAAVLGGHSYDGGWRCFCDWTGTTEEYDAHVAAALVPLIREREAAAWDAGWEDYRRWQLVTNWALDDLPANPYRAALDGEGA